MPNAATQLRRLRILIISRLLIGASLLFYAQYVFPVERLVFYAVIAFISFLSAVYVFWLLSRKHLELLAWIQISCDLLLESVLIYYTGGVDSLFAGIYVLTILSAGLIVLPSASFYVAAGSACCFVGTVLLVYFEWPPRSILFSNPTLGFRHETTYLFYASYFEITVFFLVAVLTYYFAEMIEQLQAKIRLQERLVYLGEVTSNIAHEIRNPLASISGSVELISKQLGQKLTKKQQKLMGAVVDESHRINRIFDGLLDYARIPELHCEEIPMEPFFDQIFLLMHHQNVFNSHVTIKTPYRGKHVRIYADPEQMKQVFMNIIANAYEAMPEGGSLTVDAQLNASEVLLSVQDTGKGMSSRTLKTLFMPFHTFKRKGTGLGMAQAYKIVSQHGGKIWVRSKPGHGTQVALAFPKVE